MIVGELELAFSANLSVSEANELRETLDRVRASTCSGLA